MSTNMRILNTAQPKLLKFSALLFPRLLDLTAARVTTPPYKLGLDLAVAKSKTRYIKLCSEQHPDIQNTTYKTTLLPLFIKHFPKPFFFSSMPVHARGSRVTGAGTEVAAKSNASR